MPWPRFLVFNAAGGILWSTLYGTGAYLLGDQIRRLSAPLAIAFGVIGAIAIITSVLLIRREEHRLEAEAEREFPGPLAGYPGGGRI
jgi:membrane protein DedA with SNARE-associated domain